MPYQLTIQKPVETRGVGLHTAVRCHLRLLPAPADTGIVFRRVDLDNFEIEAHVRNVARVSYATSLMKQGVLLSTVEHLLAALYSCGVDNVYVELASSTATSTGRSRAGKFPPTRPGSTTWSPLTTAFSSKRECSGSCPRARTD